MLAAQLTLRSLLPQTATERPLGFWAVNDSDAQKDAERLCQLQALAVALRLPAVPLIVAMRSPGPCSRLRAGSTGRSLENALAPNA
jgi:hypothetical protein